MSATPQPTEGDEPQIFFSEPSIDDNYDEPLKWWKANKERFPRLYAMAIDHLTIPPASTECERCFSLAKLTIGTQGHSLKANTVSKLESYRSWKDAEMKERWKLIEAEAESSVQEEALERGVQDFLT